MTRLRETDVLIIGGGLSGLRLAELLHQSDRDFRLVESRDRLGGRILSDAGFDLGPAWFWPGQPRIAALANRLNLSVFEQFSTGAFRFEDAQSRIQQGAGFGSMQGSLRLTGGMGALVHALADTLPSDRIHLGAHVTSLSQTNDGIAVATRDGTRLHAQQVVLALPPRLAADLTYVPALPASALDRLRAVPTWMAGQAKAVVLYPKPFWRNEGLSGDAMSQRGPLVEIHDASPENASRGALFGFVGVPPQHRQDQSALKLAVTAQLVRLFGASAATPDRVILRDWAFEDQTAIAADHAPLTEHPRYGLPSKLDGVWDGTLWFSGSETAKEFGGFLEGALEAAEVTCAALNQTGRTAAIA